ncbi:MAG: helix-turn-helix transcriptional regulator [Flavobacteriales bacterium]|nr:helix-turn-helix transcriptional regulator [Flavobacteriales bacterium]
MRVSTPKNHRNGYCTLQNVVGLLKQPTLIGSMNLIQIWNTLAPSAVAILSTNNPEDTRTEELDGMAQSLGCHLVLHGINDMVPCFVSTSLGRFFTMCNGKLCTAEMLQFIGRQRHPIAPFWNSIIADIEHGVRDPKLIAFCLTDINGENVWFSGVYGLLPTTFDSTPVVMSICYQIEHLGPVAFSQRNAQQLDSNMQLRFSLLSVREREVLAHMLAEKGVGQIATEMIVSIHTVNSHRKNLMAKLDVHSNMGLVAYRPYLFK